MLAKLDVIMKALDKPQGLETWLMEDSKERTPVDIMAMKLSMYTGKCSHSIMKKNPSLESFQGNTTQGLAEAAACRRGIQSPPYTLKCSNFLQRQKSGRTIRMSMATRNVHKTGIVCSGGEGCHRGRHRREDSRGSERCALLVACYNHVAWCQGTHSRQEPQAHWDQWHCDLNVCS